MNELVTQQPRGLQLRNPAGEIIQALMSGELTGEKVLALKDAMALMERMEDRNAAKEFEFAFSGLQADLADNAIVCRKGVPMSAEKGGGMKFNYAPYEQIMEIAAPLLKKWCFTMRFTSRLEGARQVAVLHLAHTAGHCRITEFAASGHTSPNNSGAQNDGATVAIAKRNAVILALNLSFDHSDDARLHGATITPAMAAELKARVAATGSDENRFLKFCDADDYKFIRSVKFLEADDFLSKKEKALKAKQSAAAVDSDIGGEGETRSGGTAGIAVASPPTKQNPHVTRRNPPALSGAADAPQGRPDTGREEVGSEGDPAGDEKYPDSSHSAGSPNDSSAQQGPVSQPGASVAAPPPASRPAPKNREELRERFEALFFGREVPWSELAAYEKLAKQGPANTFKPGVAQAWLDKMAAGLEVQS